MRDESYFPNFLKGEKAKLCKTGHMEDFLNGLYTHLQQIQVSLHITV